ncbi:RNA polymerase sigma factor [Kutzneria albida]|uniref:RNA polymerase sigma factor 70 region 4 type 2 domain-containing protein n=1 Tax=Kutzneria albida DSM 43870 TaxID=1449976 RepID=W5WDQ2_9PSEU|nr:sigma-70 family RNA polymerase sigma factor [Kutzneria albida]AHH99308.1 hypothetical protein KALB_5947 [Kutzneria albida DSM 43870]
MNSARDEYRGQEQFRAAFTEFFNSNFEAVETYIRRLWPAADATAIAQDTFAVLLLRWDEITSSRRGYAFRVARHKTIEEYQRRREVATGLADVTGVDRIVQPHYPSDQEHVVAAIHALPPRLREAISLSVLDWPPTRIAKAMRLPVRTVHGYLSEARARIHEHLYGPRRRRHVGAEDEE